MGFFSSKKETCQVCGMDMMKNNVCGYCGKSKFSKPKESLIDQKHVHSKEHVIPLKTKPKQTAQGTTQPTTTARTRPQRKSAPKTKSKNTFGFFILRLMFLGIGIGWGFLMSFLLESFDNPSGRMPETGHEGGIIIAVTAFFLTLFSYKGAFRNFLALIVLSFTSLCLIIKPIVAPVKYSGQALSFGSETHMYYWTSGVLLAVFTVLYLFTLIVRMFKWLFKSKN